MLFRFATEDDLPVWYTLATEVSQVFRHPANIVTDCARLIICLVILWALLGSHEHTTVSHGLEYQVVVVKKCWKSITKNGATSA